MKRKEITVIAQAIMIILLITACTPTGNKPADAASNTVESPAIEEEVSDLVEVDEPSQANISEDPGMVASTDAVEEISQPMVEESNEKMPTETIQPQFTALPPFMEESISPGDMQAYSFLSSSGKELDYVLYLPVGYYERPTWPIIIYLHGDRMPINNADDVLIRNPRNIIAPDSEFPFILIAPVSPTANWKFYYEPINELLDTIAEFLSIDLNAIILTGDSAGAYGAWHYALSNPDKFAAFAPVAGGPGGDPVPENICLLKDLPIWMFHSEADFTMRIKYSYSALEALENCGSNSTRMTTYIDLNHVESTYSAYANPDLYEWMLEQTK